MHSPGHEPTSAAAAVATDAPNTAPTASGRAPLPAGWQPLPRRARPLFMLTAGLPLAIVAGVAAFIGAEVSELAPALIAAPAAAALAAAFGAWFGVKQHRNTAWRLDPEGLALRRGKLWHTETRVPATRVQHLDLKRGPLQRRRHLATLVVHTAGTRHSAVTVPHLDADDAERLRDALANQIDHDGDA